jgi:T6SS, Phospholipase effector Tle1-like, catalytic domain
MALYAFDGTWNQGKTNDDTALTNTNVVRFYDAYRKRSGTEDFYVQGVGTRWDTIGKIIGGLFGLGERPRISEAYDHLCRQWATGDHTIDIVGFSRGAATTLDFCNRIQECGIRRPGSDDVVEPNPQIRFLGVWDVVAAFGLANLGNTAANLGHHLSLPKSNLRYCFHALALDERRPSFLPIRLHGACEVWFRGVHSDVGGGNGNRGLNDIALKWMMSKAKAAGLPIADADIALLNPIPGTAPSTDKPPVEVRFIEPIDRCHYTVSPLGDFFTPPNTCPVETAADEGTAIEVGNHVETLSPDQRRRVAAMWATAEAAAATRDFSIGPATDALVGLFEARVVLITSDDDLKKAGRSIVTLIARMMELAHVHGFRELHEVELNEALFNLHPLFPFTE